MDGWHIDWSRAQIFAWYAWVDGFFDSLVGFAPLLAGRTIIGMDGRMDGWVGGWTDGQGSWMDG